MLKEYKKCDVRVTSSTDPRHHNLAENPCNFDDSILHRERKQREEHRGRNRGGNTGRKAGRNKQGGGERGGGTGGDRRGEKQRV